MGDTIWVDVEGRAEDELPSDNSIMLRLEKQLDRLAAKLGVPGLKTFYDYSELEAEFADLEEDAHPDESAEVADQTASRGTWFDPAAALTSVAAIREHLARHPADLGFKPDAPRSHWPADLTEELEHVRSVLEDAAARGKKFRFLIVP